MNLLIVYSLPDLEHLNLLVLFILVVVHDVQFRQGKKPFASSSSSRGVLERSNVSACTKMSLIFLALECAKSGGSLKRVEHA